MSRFKSIDHKLDALAESLGAELSRDRPGSHELLRTFEERRIDWEEQGIRKAIIIQPTFKLEGVDQSIWNMENVARYTDQNGYRLKWRKSLVVKKEFSLIEENIDSLLSESVKNLTGLQHKDLK